MQPAQHRKDRLRSPARLLRRAAQQLGPAGPQQGRLRVDAEAGAVFGQAAQGVEGCMAVALAARFRPPDQEITIIKYHQICIRIHSIDNHEHWLIIHKIYKFVADFEGMN